MSQPTLSKHLPNIASDRENMTINTVPRFFASDPLTTQEIVVRES
jgi:hypothetical protein